MVRTGCKRELQFMLKSRSEICGGESLGRTRGSNTAAKRPPPTRCLRSASLKKIRLAKEDEEDVDDAVVSGSAEEEKSDVVDDYVDDDEGKGVVFSEETESEKKIESNGCGDVAMSEEEEEKVEKGVTEVEEAEKECSSVVRREIVMACPSGFSEFAKLTSRSCQVKLESGLGYGKPGRRLTRSMLKSEANDDDEGHVNPGKDEGSKSEANGGEDHINVEATAEGSKSEANGDKDHVNQEREAKDSCVADSGKSELNGEEDHIDQEREGKDSEDNCVDASTLVGCGKEEELPEKKSVQPCHVDKNAMSDVVDDNPLRRLTRSLGKQTSDLDDPDLENVEPSDLGKVAVHANDVGMDDFQSPPVTTPNKRGRPKKFIRDFPKKLKDLLDSGILEGLTVYYVRGAKVYMI